MVGPLYYLLTKDMEFDWIPTCHDDFLKLKHVLTQALVLKIPN